MWCRRGRCTYHDCGRGRGCLGGYRGLVGLVLRGFDFGLQVCRRVKIFAFLPHATPLYVIHTNGYGVVVGVDHGAVCRVCKAAVCLSPGTVSSLELPAYLRQGERAERCRRKPGGQGGGGGGRGPGAGRGGGERRRVGRGRGRGEEEEGGEEGGKEGKRNRRGRGGGEEEGEEEEGQMRRERRGRGLGDTLSISPHGTLGSQRVKLML